MTSYWLVKVDRFVGIETSILGELGFGRSRLLSIPIPGYRNFTGGNSHWREGVWGDGVKP